MSETVIITGAARGIGAATARLAGQRGYAVCVNYLHNHVAAERVVRDIKMAGGRAVAISADVSVEADVARLFDSCEGLLGRPSALVNNAGSWKPRCEWRRWTRPDFTGSLQQTSLDHSFALAKLCVACLQSTVESADP